MRGGGLIVSGVRTDRVAEDRFAFLIRAIVRVPVVVHHPRIDRGRGLDLGQVGLWIGLRTREVRGQAADFEERSFNGGPRHSELVVGDVNPSLDGKPILARAGKLVLLGLDHAPRNVDAHARRWER